MRFFAREVIALPEAMNRAKMEGDLKVSQRLFGMRFLTGEIKDQLKPGDPYRAYFMAQVINGQVAAVFTRSEILLEVVTDDLPAEDIKLLVQNLEEGVLYGVRTKGERKDEDVDLAGGDAGQRSPAWR